MSTPEPKSVLNDQLLQAISERGGVKHFPANAVLVTEDDDSDSLFIMLKGKVKVYGAGDNGREVVYTTHGAGEYFGEMTLDGGPRSASVMTLEATVCAVVTRKTLREHIAANPEFAFELISRVIRRARLATQSARSMALLDVYGRVVKLLNELAVQQSDGSRLIAPRLTHADVASRVGCSREMVSRLMKDLERGGYLSNHTGGWALARHLPARW